MDAQNLTAGPEVDVNVRTNLDPNSPISPVGPPVQPASEQIQSIRRFELPDLMNNAMWLMPRLEKFFHWLPPAQIKSWLTGMVYSADYQLLYLPNCVGCAQLHRAFQMEPKPVIQERFLFVRFPEKGDDIRMALGMYEEWIRWAKVHDCSTIVLQEQSDVPVELVRKMFGRVFTRQLNYVKVGDIK